MNINKYKMEEETKSKQTYLRVEVLDKGYDPLKFVEYLSEQKENGSYRVKR